MYRGPTYESDFATTGTVNEDPPPPPTERVPVPEIIRRAEREMPEPETEPITERAPITSRAWSMPPSDRFFQFDDLITT